MLNTNAAWSRGILSGFVAAAHEQGWTVLHYHPDTDIDWLVSAWQPAAAVVSPELSARSLARLPRHSLVSVNLDRSQEGIASVCLDEEAIATMAFEHLLRTGVRWFTTFRFDESPFAIERERAFTERVRAAGMRMAPGWGSGDARPEQRREDPAAMVDWMRRLPKPCGIFTFTDAWARAVARYARAAGSRVPEDVALVGADNDTLECELILPPLSSVMIPWREVGLSAARLVRSALAGESIAHRRMLLPPIGVIPRRSSDVLAVEDPLVARAVRWIRSHAERRLAVAMVVDAVGGGRQRLERRFRATLDRTIHDEIRRAHVDLARSLLETTDLSLAEVAKRSGFATAALLNVAFRRELGVPPGLYRRRVARELARPAGGG